MNAPTVSGTRPSPKLPKGVTVFERGWLSSNNILIVSPEATALIDSGYALHSAQTLALVEEALDGENLDVLVNTHLHSDHCGGNAALQKAYPGMSTFIPPGHAPHVSQWDPVALTYVPTGQLCPQFGYDAVLVPDTEIRLGGLQWQIHAAPGHDPHSVILFEPVSRTLVSADALWERGFGVVFPELEGQDAYAAVGDTLDLIASLAPQVVIPGHGPVFTGVEAALGVARERLNGFVADPVKHIRYAAKVLLKFKLLEVQRISEAKLLAWAQSTSYFPLIFSLHFAGQDFAAGITELIQELVRSGAATRDGAVLRNAG